MAEPASVEEVADAMYRMVKDATGVKKLKPMDLEKAAVQFFGADRCNKDICKKAIRVLVDSERLVYTYFGGSFVEIPPEAKGS